MNDEYTHGYAAEDEPELTIHCDIPASLRITWFVISDHGDDDLWHGKYMEDALAWLHAMEFTAVNVQTANYRGQLTITSTPDQKPDKLPTGTTDPYQRKGPDNG